MLAWILAKRFGVILGGKHVYIAERTCFQIEISKVAEIFPHSAGSWKPSLEPNALKSSLHARVLE